MKLVKYLLQTLSILISLLILLGSIVFLIKDEDILYTMNIVRQLNLETKEISIIILKYVIIASSVAIIFLSISLAFNNKIIYILTIVFSALSLNYTGVAAGIIGIIYVKRLKDNPSYIDNNNLKIGGLNLSLFIIQFVITLPISIGLLFKTFYEGIQLDPWLYFLFIPLLFVLFYLALLVISLEIVFLTIAGLFSKQKWIFIISMFGSFATLQLFSGFAAMRVLKEKNN